MKPSFHHPPILACGLALLIAACGMLRIDLRGPGGRASRGRAGQGHPARAAIRSSPAASIGGCYRATRGLALWREPATLYFAASLTADTATSCGEATARGEGTRMVKDSSPGRPGGALPTSSRPWARPSTSRPATASTAPSSGEATGRRGERGLSGTSSPDRGPTPSERSRMSPAPSFSMESAGCRGRMAPQAVPKRCGAISNPIC